LWRGLETSAQTSAACGGGSLWRRRAAAGDSIFRWRRQAAAAYGIESAAYRGRGSRLTAAVCGRGDLRRRPGATVCGGSLHWGAESRGGSLRRLLARRQLAAAAACGGGGRQLAAAFFGGGSRSNTLTLAAHETAALKLLLNFFRGTPSTSADASGDGSPSSDRALSDQAAPVVEREGEWELKPSPSFVFASALIVVRKMVEANAFGAVAVRSVVVEDVDVLACTFQGGGRARMRNSKHSLSVRQHFLEGKGRSRMRNPK